MFDANTLAQLETRMAERDYPFEQIPAEVAERRLAAARQLVVAFANLFAVTIVETNSFTPGERRNYQGEMPASDALTMLHESVVAALAGALLQARISEERPSNAFEGFALSAGPVFGETVDAAHAEVKETVETRTGRTMTELRDEARAALEVERQGRAAMLAGLGGEA